VFDEVDVILDAFPTGAGATAYESLWMGVAMVTLRGESFAGRIGASLLERLGLGHLVAGDLDEYVAIACGYANDVDLLAELRATMRQRMQDSTLCDSSGFVAELECAYRDIWRLWCVDGGETSMRGKPPRSSAAKRAE
jgi:predicted O-linked N-acetylglucosamine transferase (SPINDLY family)